ncbi:hypothetical protein GHK92_15040 [Nocardioides sp. dk4132]|uniref:hypothetical protein n=1 Tax=unclassified Nocardioides TaxID=2615069 RepID=UPI001295D066|nr:MULTISPECIES: hypothetical protein [unclassified Nocardioides]MQW77187.1 hypothetical protein [Nocardioides sp. dk4132]QGA07952.1 hypothetical protein GFH29_11520 [Nocardioides sp. dk884]
MTGEPGIQIEVPQAVISKQGRANLEAVYATAANMPVKVVPGESIVEETRQNDSDPWYGGGMLEAPGFNPPNDLNPYLFCSTGFAVLATGNYGRLLSARHCDDDLANNICNRAWKDGAHDNLTVGDASVDCRVNNDTMLIDPIGGTDGWVHGGPWNATSSHSRYHLKVAGSDRAFQNEWVCESGANSGEHCGLQIEEATLRQWNCGPGQCHGWTADDRNSSTMTSAGGDSGGPVYHPRGDGRVGARGIHYGGTGNPTCSPVRFAVSNCSNKSTFVDIVRILNQWDVDIETTP